MYAEIKSTNQILINRLDENEKLLLKDIVEKAKNSKVELKELLLKSVVILPNYKPP